MPLCVPIFYEILLSRVAPIYNPLKEYEQKRRDIDGGDCVPLLNRERASEKSLAFLPLVMYIQLHKLRAFLIEDPSIIMKRIRAIL